MPNTRYRRGKVYAADMAAYSIQISADNSKEISRLKRNLIRCLQEDVTPRQRQALLMYYAQGMNMRGIGEQLGVDKSTVSWGKPIDGVAPSSGASGGCSAVSATERRPT